MGEILYFIIHVLTIIIVHGHLSIISRELDGIYLISTPLFDYFTYFLTLIWLISLLFLFLHRCYLMFIFILQKS